MSERRGPMWAMGVPSEERLQYLRGLAHDWITGAVLEPNQELPKAWWLVDRAEDLLQLLDEIARLRRILTASGIDPDGVSPIPGPRPDQPDNRPPGVASDG